MARIARILVTFFLVLALGGSAAWGAGPFLYRLPQGPGVDLKAVTVVRQPLTYHIGRNENMHKTAQGFANV